MKPLHICHRVLEMVGGRADTEVTATSGHLELTRFANSFIHQNVADAQRNVTLKVAAAGRVASAGTTRVDDEGLRKLVEGALTAAALMPIDEEYPGLAPPAPVAAVDHYDSTTAGASAAERAGQVKDFVAAGPSMRAAGYCDTESMEIAFANSAGQQAEGRDTRSTIDGIQQAETSAGSGHQTEAAFSALDGAAVGAQAAQRAADGSEAYDIKPGEYEVVLSPDCVGTIAVFLAAYGFNGKAVVDGQSFIDPGTSQFDEQITLVSDVADERSLGVGFDTEGTPKPRLELIAAGVTGSAAHDRRSAYKAGTESTGHGGPWSATWGPIPTNMILEPGSVGEADMIAAIGRGLYVATFNYCRILDPKTQVVTGLTRNGTFMIENGAITGAVTNLRFTQSFVTALGPGRVLGVGRRGRFADSEFGPGVVHAPALHLAGWNFTGGAEG